MPCNPAMTAPFTPRGAIVAKTIRMTELNKLTPHGVPDHHPAAGASPRVRVRPPTPHISPASMPSLREAVETLADRRWCWRGPSPASRVFTCRIAHSLSLGRAVPVNPVGHLHQQGGSGDELRLGQMLGQALKAC